LEKALAQRDLKKNPISQMKIEAKNEISKEKKGRVIKLGQAYGLLPQLCRCMYVYISNATEFVPTRKERSRMKERIVRIATANYG
jgi:hypothetical protein